MAAHAHITRRAALVALPATLAISTAASPHPDALILGLGRELEAAFAAERAAYGLRSAEYEAASDVAAAVVARIEEATATTVDGLKVKLQAFHWCRYDCGPMGDSTDVRLIEQIVDLLEHLL